MAIITDAYIDEIERKIDEGGNGDVDRMELALLMAIYNKVDCLENNPAVKFGEAVKENKALAAFAVFLFWLFVVFLPQTLIRLIGWDHLINLAP